MQCLKSGQFARLETVKIGSIMEMSVHLLARPVKNIANPIFSQAMQ